MSKIAIVYWSATGNTEMMAEAVKEGAENAGAEVSMFSPAEFSADDLDKFDAVAFGCPAMGDEVLEEDEFEPMFAACEPNLKGKKIGLFGSFGWGDGQWMRDWDERARKAGAEMADDCVTACGAPNEDAKDSCRNMGKVLA